MERSKSLMQAITCTAVCVSLCARPAFCATVGGWSASRGGAAGLLSGDDFAGIRNDLVSFFPGVMLSDTSELTPAYLNTIDVLLLDPVFSGADVPIAPLSASEQAALTSWVSVGGRALVLGENSSYTVASRSMIEPFGPLWRSAFATGARTGTVMNHASFPTITYGTFGVVNTFKGAYVSSFQSVSPATALGTWDFNGEAALAAMQYGSGNVVFFGDNEFLLNVEPSNEILRRNTLAYLLGIAPTIQFDYNHNGFVDTADYVIWRKTFGEIGAGRAADGNRNGEVDNGDYDVWRAHFGQTAVGGATFPSAKSLSAAVPEPAGLILAIAALLIGAAPRTCRPNRESMSFSLR